MTITALLDLQLQVASLADAPALLREVLADTRAFDGCLGVDVIVDSNDPAHMIVVETWASRAHDDAYRAWRLTEAGQSPLGTLLAAPPTLSWFETSITL
jgi:quinol monooxygenase YgiN